MRAYFFGNMYLSSIQQGIQAAHATAEMFTKYDTCEYEKRDLLHAWASNHKTMILLNAGYSEEIHKLVEFFKNEKNPFPWAPFHEGVDALDGALTTVGIVLPEEIYNAAKNFREGPKGNPADLLTAAIAGDMSGLDPWNGYKPTMWEQELAQRINNYGFAR